MIGRKKAGHKPTRKQMKVYRWIRSQVPEPQVPTVVAVALRFKTTCTVIHEEVMALVELGYLERSMLDGTPCYRPTQTCPNCGHPITTDQDKKGR